MNFFARLGRLFDHLNVVMVVISAILLLGLTFIVGADITLRYLFNKPLGWVKEVSEYTLVGLGFLVAAWILRDDGHVKMDLVLNKLPPRAQTMMNIITSGISTIVVSITTWIYDKGHSRILPDQACGADSAGAPKVDPLNTHSGRQFFAYRAVHTQDLRLYRQVEKPE